MSKLYFGSVNFSQLLKMAKEANPAFSRAENGNVYLNLNIWVNDEKDQFGNDASIQTSFKDAQKDERVYVGNLKELVRKEPAPLTTNDADEFPEHDDLPF